MSKLFWTVMDFSGMFWTALVCSGILWTVVDYFELISGRL
jgi:hypothetical protein